MNNILRTLHLYTDMKPVNAAVVESKWKEGEVEGEVEDVRVSVYEDVTPASQARIKRLQDKYPTDNFYYELTLERFRELD